MKLVALFVFFFSFSVHLLAQNSYVQFDTTDVDYNIKISNNERNIYITKDTITRAQANGDYTLAVKIKNISKQLITLPTYGTCWNDVMHISRFGKTKIVSPGDTHILPIKIRYGKYRTHIRKTSYINILDTHGTLLEKVNISLRAYIND